MTKKVLYISGQFDTSARDAKSPYPGGAEQTGAALMKACPWPVARVRSVDISAEELRDYDIHIVGNLGKLDLSTRSHLIAGLTRSGRHIMLEHDLRICTWGANFWYAWEPVHFFSERCICPHRRWQDLYRSARATVFLSHKQRGRFIVNPFFRTPRHDVLGSSAFSETTLARVDAHRRSGYHGRGTCICFSRRPAKGYDRALQYCKRRGVTPTVIRDATPAEVLDHFAAAEEFVFLPRIKEASSRLVIEARMMGCRIVANENVGVIAEPWWHRDDEFALAYIRDTPDRFWRIVSDVCEADPVSHP